jgi:uncharacterized Zn-finger protein
MLESASIPQPPNVSGASSTIMDLGLFNHMVSVQSVSEPLVPMLPSLISSYGTVPSTSKLRISDAIGLNDVSSANICVASPPTVPLPHIPKDLRNSLSDKMFRHRKRDSKHSNTHTKKSHIVRYEAINQQCMMCKKAFSRPCALKTHIYTHTGEKPYCCPIKDCTHRFSVRSNLRRHTSTMHPTI